MKWNLSADRPIYAQLIEQITSAIVAGEYPGLRIPSLSAGLVLTVIYILALAGIPQEFRLFILVWNLITILSMCGGRIVFSLLHRKN